MSEVGVDGHRANVIRVEAGVVWCKSCSCVSDVGLAVTSAVVSVGEAWDETVKAGRGFESEEE